jgi:DNA-binding CsgD family transcriptional regulator
VVSRGVAFRLQQIEQTFAQLARWLNLSPGQPRLGISQPTQKDAEKMSHSPALAPARASHPAWQFVEPIIVAPPFVEADGRDNLDATTIARTALRDAFAAAAEAADRALFLAQLLEEVMAGLPEVAVAPERADPPASVPCGPDRLSPREQEVLALVAAGRTNKAIASALYVSPNTVKTHVTSLLHKLRADSRVQLAAIATKHCLHAASDPLSPAASRP